MISHSVSSSPASGSVLTAQCLETLLVVTDGSAPLASRGVEARSGVPHPTVYRTAPHIKDAVAKEAEERRSYPFSPPFCPRAELQ